MMQVSLLGPYGTSASLAVTLSGAADATTLAVSVPTNSVLDVGVLQSVRVFVPAGAGTLTGTAVVIGSRGLLFQVGNGIA